MFNDDTRKKLNNIIQGNVIEGDSDYLTAARNYLCRRFGTSTTIERNFEHQAKIKEEQSSDLIKFINE